MSIYIFKPSAAATTPTWDAVLAQGGTLTDNYSILQSAYNLYFTNGYVNFTCQTADQFFTFFSDNSTANSIFYGTSSGNQTGIYIDMKNQVYKFGDFANGQYFSYDIVTGKVQATGGLIQWNGGVVRNQTDTFSISESTLGAGQITISGTGYTAATAGGSAGQHLIVRINGVVRKIALLLP